MVDDPLADLEHALGDVLEAGDHAQRSRLAAAGRPDEDHELAVLDLQIDRVDGARPVGVDLAYAVESDSSHRFSPGREGLPLHTPRCPRHRLGRRSCATVRRVAHAGLTHRHDLDATRAGGPRAIAIALALVLGFAGVEAIAGLAAGSLALLADAAHMLSDAPRARTGALRRLARTAPGDTRAELRLAARGDPRRTRERPRACRARSLDPLRGRRSAVRPARGRGGLGARGRCRRARRQPRRAARLARRRRRPERARRAAARARRSLLLRSAS